MKHGSLFSGIGGFDLASQWMGWENVFHCEWNEFGQKILKYYWPNAISYGDITKTDFTIWRGKIDIITGGFPCQPYSLAGKRKGKEDERHLWPEMLRSIREIQPNWVVGENVPGIINWSGGLVFHEVQTDLEAQGYEVFPVVLPACGVNAPHKRERIWFVAHNNSVIRGTKKRQLSKQQKYGRQLSRLSGTISKGTSSNSEILGERSGAKEQREDNKRRKQLERSTQRGNGDDNGIGRIDCNTECKGLEVGSEPSEYPINSEHKRLSKKRDVTNSQDERLQRSKSANGSKRKESDDKQFDGCSRIQQTWDNFPTQSPLCSRDDGISSRLDGITFPKWRNESIKAYGNAIVPQVALQIFKAIEEFVLNENKV